MRIQTIFRLWLPLAVSFELMMLEGPAVQGAIGRLADPQINLAAWGLALGLALLVESPVIMLLATSIALVRDAPSYHALRRFMLTLCGICTAATALIAFTPLFHVIARDLMGQPAPIAVRARPALQILLLWTAAIAWRRFYQGILVSRAQTRLVSFGTMIRLSSEIGMAVALTWWGRIPGVQVAACTLMTGVLTEAAATTRFALPLVRRDLLNRTEADAPSLSQRAIARFHAPLAAATLLTLLVEPMTAAALARLAMPRITLAAWPVTYMVVLVIRGWGMALQEITVAQAGDPQAQPALRRFAWMVGLATSGAVLLLAGTPLLTLYFRSVLHLPETLQPYARLGVTASLLLPLLTALSSHARGLLVASGASRSVYRGMGLNLAINAALLTSGVALRLPGMWVAVAAYTLAAIVEFNYLSRCAWAADALPERPTPAGFASLRREQIEECS